MTHKAGQGAAKASWVKKCVRLLVLTPLLLNLLYVLSACTPASQPMPVSLIYSGNLDGELEPCGCSEQGDLGGLKRRAQLLDDLHKQQANLIVVSAGGLISSDGGADRVKSEFILEGFKALNYDAVALQWKDTAFGESFLNAQKLPWVSSNWKDNSFAKRVEVKRGNLSLHIYAWLDPAGSPTRKMVGQHDLVSDDKDKLQAQIKQSHDSGAMTLLAVDKPLEDIQSLFDLSKVDLLLIKSKYEEFSAPQQVANTLVLQAGSRGMRLGRLDFQFNPKATTARISDLKSTVLPMPKSIVDAPRMLDWYQRYNDRVKQDYLKRVEIRKQQESGVSPYAGSDACEKCHAKAYQTWSDSEHAKAFEDLENVGKSFDPECLQCHTVGFEKPGGFFDAMITSQLTAVQCENCHGAAREHVESGGAKPVANKAWTRSQMCAQCHTQPHSPGFSEDKYWPKIAHSR